MSFRRRHHAIYAFDYAMLLSPLRLMPLLMPDVMLIFAAFRRHADAAASYIDADTLMPSAYAGAITC